ncbi:hypothetical protein [Actinomycetospora aeridis]|uniref:Uncharacterized protein n=1 Tax=Actinomycetospora aeridis TaxID=3129231 RepID=A0ABU8MZN6_9PSEU
MDVEGGAPVAVGVVVRGGAGARGARGGGVGVGRGGVRCGPGGRPGGIGPGRPTGRPPYCGE